LTQETTSDRIAILSSRRPRECRESHLVLVAAEIPAEIVRRGETCELLVRHADLTAAVAELEAYREENPASHDVDPAGFRSYGGALAGVMTYAFVLILTAFLADFEPVGRNWFAAGEMQAGRVLDGERWRVVTALSLHIDAGHLISNLVFGCLFGAMAGQLLGGGVAWLVIVVAGSLGNLMNAAIQPLTHTSIGASTAVFAALGLIAVTGRQPGMSRHQRLMKRWSPLVGGLVLLGLLGVGDARTDFLSHVCGFLAGLVTGWAVSGLPSRLLGRRDTQIWAGSSAVAMVAFGWALALAATAQQ